MKAVLAVLLLITGIALPGDAGPQQPKRIAAAEASKHIGERAQVCGLVAGGKYADKANGQPTFLDFEKKAPNQIFSVVIWGTHRKEFGEPERELLGKKVCVTGLIKNYKDKPQIEATAKSQVNVE